MSRRKWNLKLGANSSALEESGSGAWSSTTRVLGAPAPSPRSSNAVQLVKLVARTGGGNGRSNFVKCSTSNSPKTERVRPGNVGPLRFCPRFIACGARLVSQTSIKQWRQRRRARGEVPVGEGALDETFDLAFKTEARNASREHQAGVFLDCSKCYERVPLAQLEQFAIERGFPLYALNCALSMYSGSRRILIQGAVSEAVQSTCGLPPGCGLAIDLLHAFLIRTLQSAGRQVEVRKYVDDMVL
eukprot:5101521-Amphidinium_carterae.1